MDKTISSQTTWTIIASLCTAAYAYNIIFYGYLVVIGPFLLPSLAGIGGGHLNPGGLGLILLLCAIPIMLGIAGICCVWSISRVPVEKQNVYKLITSAALLPNFTLGPIVGIIDFILLIYIWRNSPMSRAVTVTGTPKE